MTRVFFSLLASVAGARIIGLMTGLMMTSALLAALTAPAYAETRQDAVIGLQLEPPHLDPTSAAAGAIDQVLYANVYEGLTRFTENGNIIPHLAASWDISDDGRRYQFTLHPDMRFHDGAVLDAKAVKFSLDRARSDTSTNAQKALFQGISQITVTAPNQLTIDLNQPDGNFLFKLAWGDAVIIAPNNVDHLKQSPIGSGPFTLTSWVKGDRILLQKNPDYWGKPAALEQVTFRFISDPVAAMAAMQTGEIDAFPVFPAPENLAMLATDARLKLINGSTEGETILAINNARPPFDQRLVRQAIAMAINKQDIINGAMFGYGTPIGSHFAPHHPDYIDLTNAAPYDPAAARQMLADAEITDLHLTISLPPPVYARRGGEIIMAQLSQIGIKVTLEPLEWAQWLEKVFRNKDYDLTIVSHTEPFDIGIYARPDYYFQYDNAPFQSIMAELDITTDPADRRDLLHQAQRHIADDQVNVYLFQLANAGITKTDLVGIWQHAPTQAMDMTGVYWKN
tara:strand:- start:772 stop:2304 length:1533 start_codon:yes stop_codon:yes gene_type:complete